MSAPAGYWQDWQPAERRRARPAPPPPSPPAVAFADGRAYAEGERRRSERTALATAAGYLADPVHGARRAMLVLAGHVRVPAEVVAR